MWSMKISKRLVVMTSWRMRTLCVGFCRLSGIKQQCFFATSWRTLQLRCFPASFEWNLWTFFPFLLQLSILILRKNYQSHTMDSFIFLYSLLLFTIPPTSIPPRLAVFYPALLCLSTKGPVMPLDQGREVIIFNRYISPRGWPPVPFLFLSDPFVVLSDAPNLTQAPAGNLMSL